MDPSEVVERALSHVSENPWSEYKESDYTVEQWHAACLIHLHDGPPTSKSQCKLPVKTPNGALNRNGVHAAAAALAGARSPLQAPPDQKAKAANVLRRYYSQLGETPPDSLKQSAINILDVIGGILEHHGVKGMKWGVRRDTTRQINAMRREVHQKHGVGKLTTGFRASDYKKMAAANKEFNLRKAQILRDAKAQKSRPQPVTIRGSKFPGSTRLKTTGGKGYPATKEAVDTRTIGQIGRKSGTKALSNRQLEEYNRRLQLEQNFKRLSTQDLSPGRRMALRILGQTGNQTSQNVANEASAVAVKKALKLAAVAA